MNQHNTPKLAKDFKPPELAKDLEPQTLLKDCKKDCVPADFSNNVINDSVKLSVKDIFTDCDSLSKTNFNG